MSIVKLLSTFVFRNIYSTRNTLLFETRLLCKTQLLSFKKYSEESPVKSIVKKKRRISSSSEEEAPAKSDEKQKIK